jgi:hypothetical protein
LMFFPIGVDESKLIKVEPVQQLVIITFPW